MGKRFEMFQPSGRIYDYVDVMNTEAVNALYNWRAVLSYPYI